ncbi:MAG: tetratricopeptide repeat protein, partial [Pirellulales bacterium]|nr:tetratricopeptide repeat protein [Pirellulales bacterium]
KKAPAEIQQYALTLKCQVNAADEHWDQVRKAAERLLTDHPESSFRRVAEFWVAESLYHQADYDAAATRLDALTDRAHEPDETWLAMVPLRRAQIFAMRKQWTEAFDQASTIERDYPGFDRQYEVDYLLGRCLAARAQFDQARQAYRRAIDSPHGAKTETAAMAQWMIGETYFHQKHYEAALREYLRVEILYDFPRWQAAALLQAGKCHERLSRNDEAARLYRSLVKTYPDSPLVEKAKKRLAATAGSNGASEARRPTAPRR